ncbi:MAG: class I SAM-dependent methyltransferase [Salinivirgaceae bacterium]|nr:class I SAM-dependent methyltransferase [Salinivirgaceae bacterium]
MMNNDFWELMFKEQGAFWEFAPSGSSILVAGIIEKNGINKVLIPGVGYGRNTKPFIESGFDVSGIEISKSAIKLARKYGLTFPIHLGSVLDMPFVSTLYDGIFCYSLLHLFNKRERFQILKNCYNQLDNNGVMVFVVVSVKAEMYGTGKLLSKNRFKIDNGLNVFFYESKAIETEFRKF